MLKSNIQSTAWLIALTGLFTEEIARAFTSISMILLVVVNIYLSFAAEKQKHLNPFKNTILITVAGFVLIYGFAFFYSSPLPYLIERIIIKLPFIVIPLSILHAPALNSQQVKQIIILFSAMVSFVAFVMLINYLMHFDEFNKMYAMSSVMPSPINHIRLSLIFAFTSYLLYYLIFIKHSFTNSSTQKMIALSAMFFIIIFTHIYSVRGGLIALYSIALYEFVRHLLHTKHAKKLMISGLLAFGIALFSAFTVPTIKNKIAITIEELNKFKDGKNLNHSSLGKRLASYEIAWSIFKEHPATGCGIGNYTQKNKSEFNSLFPEVEVPIIVHNQFLYYLAASGLIGFLVFSFSFFFPLLKHHHYPNLFIIHLILLFVSFQTEPMLETQLGIAYAVLFWAFSLSIKPATNKLKIE